MAGGHGGRRHGAGRPAGSGNPIAVAERARRTVAVSVKQSLREVLGTDRDPANVLLDLAHDEDQDARLRMEAAATLMPYAYPRLALSVTDTTVRHTRDEGDALAELRAKIGSLASPTAPTIEAAPEAAEVGE